MKKKEKTIDLELLRGAFDSISRTMAFDSRDWSVDQKDAWLYGIVNGLDDHEEFQRRFSWDNATIARLQKMHKEVANFRDAK